MTFGRWAASPNGDGLLLRHGELELHVPTPRLETPANVLVGIRPEHARLWDDRSGLLGPLTGTVEFVEALGRESLVGVRAGEARYILAAEGRIHTQIGVTVQFGLQPGRLYLFDPESTRALGQI
jgi:ABC-type sugar transport system ATPase subunit